MPALEIPHGYRCSVRELVEDARALRSFFSPGSYRPQLGDLLISARAGGSPLRGGPGHVERVSMPVGPPDTGCRTIGANERNTWIVESFSFSDPFWVGTIAVDPELGALAVLIALEEHARGVRELAGAASHPAIQLYDAGARRGGSDRAGMPGHEHEGDQLLGSHASDEIAWCASGACWTYSEAWTRRARAFPEGPYCYGRDN